MFEVFLPNFCDTKRRFLPLPWLDGIVGFRFTIPRPSAPPPHCTPTFPSFGALGSRARHSLQIPHFQYNFRRAGSGRRRGAEALKLTNNPLLLTRPIFFNFPSEFSAKKSILFRVSQGNANSEYSDYLIEFYVQLFEFKYLGICLHH